MRVALAHSWRKRERGGGGERERERDRQTDRQTHRHTDTQTDTQTDRQTERERERERELAFVYNICMCTWSSVRTCVLCWSMRVNVFVKL